MILIELFGKMSDNEIEVELDYPEEYSLPLLFCIDKRGKKRMWKIWTEGNIVHRIQGLVDGKKQTYMREYTGKNIGKSNETTPEEQAKQAAETMWTKQIDKGYFPKCKEGKALVKKVQKSTSTTGGHNINAGAAIRSRKQKKTTKTNNFAVSSVEKPVKPMKASVWELDKPSVPTSVQKKVLKYFDFDEGVYLQWKLDGWRCIARPQDDNVVVLTTNNGKQYPWFESLRQEILKFIQGQDILDGLDGELYCHTLFDSDGNELSDEARFSTISSMCGISRTSPHPLENQICFVVFDLVDLSGTKTQDERFELLKKLFGGKKGSKHYTAISKKFPHIQRCETKVCYHLEEVVEYHNKVAQQGFEGVVIRSRNLKYSQKRSLEMRKYKNFIDKEYTIIDVHKDPGVDDEYFVWICEDNGVRFKVKPRGSRFQRREWFSNSMSFIGSKLTVKFQEYSEDKVPRFPVGVGIREDQ